MGFIQLCAGIMSMSQIMMSLLPQKATFLPNLSTLMFFVMSSFSLSSLLDRTVHPKPQITLIGLVEVR